jgi:hypothetical protein
LYSFGGGQVKGGNQDCNEACDSQGKHKSRERNYILRSFDASETDSKITSRCALLDVGWISVVITYLSTKNVPKRVKGALTSSNGEGTTLLLITTDFDLATGY